MSTRSPVRGGWAEYELEGSNGASNNAMMRIDDADHPASKAKCCNAYFKILNTCKYLVLFIWICALGASVYLGPRMLNSTKDSFSAPTGTPAAIAQEVWTKQYPEQAQGHSLIVLLTSNDKNQSIIYGDGYTYALSVDTQLRTALLNRTESELEHASDYVNIISYFNTITSPVPALASSLIAPDELSMVFNIEYNGQKDNGGNTAIGEIVKHIRSFVSNINTQGGKYSLGVTGGDALDADIGNSASKDFEHTDAIILPIALFVLMIYLKSFRLMVLPLLNVILSLLGAFAVMYPIALWLLHVSSFAPSIMASLTVAMSVDYSLFLLTRFREEILSGQHRLEMDAVRATLRTSGEVVLASGFTLALTFASLIAFPMDFLQSIGIAACSTILMCLFVNLTFTPAMLLTFPRFFANFTLPRCCLCILPSSYTKDVPARAFGDYGLDEAFLPSAMVNSDGMTRSAGIGAGLDRELLYEESDEVITTAQNGRSNGTRIHQQQVSIASRAISPTSSSSRYSVRSYVDVVGDDGLNEASRSALNRTLASPRIQAQRREQENSLWFKSAVLSTTTPISILLALLVLGASIPFIFATIRLHWTIDQNQLLPSDSTAVQVLKQMELDFPPGLITQYHVLLTVDPKFIPHTPNNSTIPFMPILSSEYLSVTTQLVQNIISNGLAVNTSILSLVYAGAVGSGIGDNGWTTTTEQAIARLTGCVETGDEASCLFSYQLLETANENGNPIKATCTQISIMTSFNPMGDQAMPWVKNIRKLLDHLQAETDLLYPNAFKYYLTGGATSAIDAITRIYDLLPIVVGVTGGVILLLVGLLFKSFLVPLRLVITLAVPLVYTYGLSIYAYQDHKFSFLGNKVNGTKGLYWLNPVMALMILVGLGLDYDLFLSLRIAEFRSLGYTNRSSIRKGIWKTGSIISGAGLIMAIAFFGLMLSSTSVLLEFGSMLCFAVILDTFIVRTIFLPAVLHLLGEATWWPNNIWMKKPTKGDLEQDVEGIETEKEQEERMRYSFR
jgi:uncharacterized membrane protein YdfJ with MMPL/SSD domain